jgi:hypothetical protein
MYTLWFRNGIRPLSMLVPETTVGLSLTSSNP